MFKKISIALIAVSVFFLLFLSQSKAQNFSSTAEIDHFDDQVRIKFDLDKKDKKNLSQIARSLGFLGLNEIVTLAVSTEVVDLLTRWNLSPVKLTTTEKSLSFQADGNLNSTNGFNSQYVDNNTYFWIEGGLVKELKPPYQPLFNDLLEPSLSLTFFDNQPALVFTAHLADKAKFESQLADLKRKKTTALEQTTAANYTEFEIGSQKGISLSALNAPTINLVIKDSQIIASDNLNLLKNLLSKESIVSLDSTSEFKAALADVDLKKETNVDVLYVNFEKLLKSDVPKSLGLLSHFSDFELTDEFKAQLNYANLKSLSIFWTDKEINGVLKIK